MDARALTDAVSDLLARNENGAATELVVEHWRVWLEPGAVAGGLATTTALLASGRSTDAPRVRVLYANGVLAFRSGDQARSRASNEEALQLARAIDDARGECDALTGLARVALRAGRYDEVVRLAKQACLRADAAGDGAAKQSPLHLEAAGLRLGGEHAAAREVYLETLRRYHEIHDSHGIAMELHNLGWVEIHLGNVDEAERLFGELEDHPAADEYLAAWRLLNRAALDALRGDRERAALTYQEGARTIRELAVTPDPDDQFELDWLKSIL